MRLLYRDNVTHTPLNLNKKYGMFDLQTGMSTIKNSVEILSTESDLHLYKMSENDLVLNHWYPEFHLIVK